MLPMTYKVLAIITTIKMTNIFRPQRWDRWFYHSQTTMDLWNETMLPHIDYKNQIITIFN
jgi:hypothetical protein